MCHSSRRKSPTARRGKCYIDSGTTPHHCNDLDLFTTSHQVNSGVKLTSNATVNVNAKGSVRMKVSNGDNDISVSLQNTLFIPELRTNLLLVAKIVDKEPEILFTEHSAFVKDKVGKVMMIADRAGNLFYLRLDQDAACAAADKAASQMMKWNQISMHLNRDNMAGMVRASEPPDIKCTGPQHSKADLRDCVVGKMASAPFQKRKIASTGLLEIVHADLCGPFTRRLPLSTRLHRRLQPLYRRILPTS